MCADALGAETDVLEDVLGEVGDEGGQVGVEEGLDLFHLRHGIRLVLPPETVAPVVEEGLDVLECVERGLVPLAHVYI